MEGEDGRALPIMSVEGNSFVVSPVPIRGEPVAGVKLVPAAVNCGMPVMEAESKLKPESAA